MKNLSRKQASYKEEVPEPHLLLVMPWGIGDTISVGLSAVDQIARNDPEGRVKIEVLCNPAQSELLAHDPRIYRIIQADTSLFPTNEEGSWKRGIFLSPREVWHLLSVLHKRREVSMQTFIREIINNYFGKELPEPADDEEIPLYISRQHIQHTMREIERIKGQTAVPRERARVLLVSPDTSSVITRPPTALLAEGIAGALKHNDELIAVLLPSYTDRDATPRLMRTLAPSFPGRIVAMPAEPKMPLPELAAFIDQCDMLVTGDTSVMHLAVATKKVRDTTSVRSYCARRTHGGHFEPGVARWLLLLCQSS